MKELREIYDFGQLDIITEKVKLPKYALAKLSYLFARADTQNSNHRTYSESILSREIGKKSEELRTQKIPGMLNHPLSGITQLDKIAHVLNSVSYDRTTKLASAESYVLDTSKGRDFMVMLEAELSMGCSMRGWGNVKNGYVQSDWKLDTLDFVLNPSFSDAMIDQSNIIESANNIFDEKNNKGGNMNEEMMGLTEDFVESMMKSVWEIYGNEEIPSAIFEGTLEDFKRENGKAVKAEILVAEGKCKDTEEALKHLSKFEKIEETKRIPTVPIRKKVTSGEICLEAKMSGVDPKIYAEKLNANLERQEEVASDSELSPAEVSFVIQEARQAGFNTGDEKERKRLLDIARKQKTKKVLNGDEKAEIIAKRTGSTKEFVKEVWAIEEKKKKKMGKISLLVSERMASGFGSEVRPESRRISKKILEGE